MLALLLKANGIVEGARCYREKGLPNGSDQEFGLDSRANVALSSVSEHHSLGPTLLIWAVVLNKSHIANLLG